MGKNVNITHVSLFSLPQEDSDYEREHTPPTPPPRKAPKRGASLRLACIGRQESDENPLMKLHVAAPLKLAQTQVSKPRKRAETQRN